MNGFYTVYYQPYEYGSTVGELETLDFILRSTCDATTILCAAGKTVYDSDYYYLVSCVIYYKRPHIIK